MPRLGEAANPIDLGDPRPMARLALDLLEGGGFDEALWSPDLEIADWLGRAWEVIVEREFGGLRLEASLTLEIEGGSAWVGLRAEACTFWDASEVYAALEVLSPGAGQGVLALVESLGGPMPVLTPNRALEFCRMTGTTPEGMLPEAYASLEPIPRGALEALARGERPVPGALFPEIGVPGLARLRAILEAVRAVEIALEALGEEQAGPAYSDASWLPGYGLGLVGPRGDLCWHAAMELEQYAREEAGIELGWRVEIEADEPEGFAALVRFLDCAPMVLRALERLLDVLGTEKTRDDGENPFGEGD